MKRLAALVLVVLLLLALSFQYVMAGSPASHEDPDQARPSIDAYSWLAFYGQVVSLLTAGQYGDVDGLLDELRGVDMPDEFKTLLTRFNGMVGELTDDIAAFQLAVDEVRLCIDERDATGASAALQQARELLRSSRSQAAELRQSVDEISSRLGIFSLIGAVAGPTMEAYRQLEGLLAQLESLEDEYDRLLLSLQTEVELLQHLKPSELTLELSAGQAWVGETVTLSGRLQGEDAAPLADRAVSITLDGAAGIEMTTDSSGAYAGQLQIPYRYVETMVLQAWFVPSTTDSYEGSDSGGRPITVLFAPTRLTLEADPVQAWVGETIGVSGQLTSLPDDSPLAGRTVRVSLAGSETLVVTGADGAFEGDLPVPFRYVSSLPVLAEYLQEQSSIYRSSMSPIVDIAVLFVPTQLTLELAPAQAWVGESVAVSGRLTSLLDGSPLPGRTVKVTLDTGETAVVTGADGSFEGELPVPFHYISSLPVRAVYPQEQSSLYRSSSSPAAELTLLFYATDVSLQAQTLYPGWPAAVEGVVSSEGLPQGNRAVELFFDGSLVGSGITGPDGHFAIAFAPAPDVALGKHEVAILVAGAGLYAGGSARGLMEVVTLTPEVTLRHPGVVLVPGDMNIRGAVMSPLSSVSGARVKILWDAEWVIEETAEDGAFSGSLSTSFGAGIVMFRRIVVLIEPTQPWYQPAQAVSEIMVVNLVNIGFLSAGLLSVGAVLYARRRMDAGRVPVERFFPAADGDNVPLILAPETRLRLDSTRQRVLAAYVAAVRQAEISTGVRMRPQTTLREYLGEVTSLIGAESALEGLTGLAEEAAYGPHPVTEARAWQAEELSQAFRESVRDKLPAERSHDGNS